MDQSATAETGFARILSILFNPLVIGVPAVLAIGIKDQGGIDLSVGPSALLAITVMCILPLLYIRVLLSRGVVKNFNSRSAFTAPVSVASWWGVSTPTERRP